LGQDELNDVWHHQILSDTGSEVSCDDRNSYKEDLGDPREQDRTKSIENHLHLKRRFYLFQLNKEIFIGEHMNNYTKLHADLANMDDVIKDEDNTFILLSSLSDDDYETFVLALSVVSNT